MKNNMNSLTIKEWAAEERPSYKIIEKGTDGMSNSELLSLIIGSGTHQYNAVEIARMMLARYNNNLNALGKADLHSLLQSQGIGHNTAIRIMAAFELGKRRQVETALNAPQLSSASVIYELMRPQMMDLKHEEAYVLLMNNSLKLIRQVKISSGGLTETAVDVRSIMKSALAYSATAIVLIHNHPSGNCFPSTDDNNITSRIKKACDLMRIYFADHVIITDGNYYSYRESGRI